MKESEKFGFDVAVSGMPSSGMSFAELVYAVGSSNEVKLKVVICTLGVRSLPYISYSIAKTPDLQKEKA